MNVPVLMSKRSFWLKTQLWLPQPREKIFRFFSNPANLDHMTPAWLHFEMLASPPAVMMHGILLDYRLRLHGLPVRWQSEITAWDPPTRFVDQQTRGPYSTWIHEHLFEEYGGGTLVRDNVEYGVPGGRVVEKLLVGPDLKRIFAYRQRVLEQLFNPNKRATKP
jgi:ligand-binding SRPBCC domain-containing protein